MFITPESTMLHWNEGPNEIGVTWFEDFDESEFPLIGSVFFTGVDAELLGFLGLTDDPAPDGECWEGVRSWTAGGFMEAGCTSGHGH